MRWMGTIQRPGVSFFLDSSLRMCKGYILPLCTERLDAKQQCIGMKRDIVSSTMADHLINVVERSGHEDETVEWIYTTNLVRHVLDYANVSEGMLL